MRETLKGTEVKRWDGEQAHRWVGSLKPLQDLQLLQTVLWTCFRSVPLQTQSSELGACPTGVVLLRQTIHAQLQRSRPETILNVFQRIRFRFFRACGLVSGRASSASLRRHCRTGS